MDVTIRVHATSALPPAVTSVVPYAAVLAHPEQFYNAGDIVWVTMASALVFLMIPALSLIYAGLSNRSFAMSMFRLPLMTAAVVGLQWAFWGYSLTFTDGTLGSGWYGGEPRANALADVVARPITVGNGDGPPIPELLYVLYEGMFAAFTAAIVCGGTIHRVKPARFLVFITLWSILIYDVIARWTWHGRGWSNRLGVLDFAGGTPVHITSGTTVAAFALFYDFEVSDKAFFAYIWHFSRRVLERIQHNFLVIWNLVIGGVFVALKRAKVVRGSPNFIVPPFEPEETPDEKESDPYSNIYVALGTGILWFGWAGFNGGSALGGNLRAVSAWLSTHIAACSGGVVGILWQWYDKLWEMGDRDFATRDDGDRHVDQTVLWFCDGAIAGLIAITPGSGYVPVWSAPIFGAAAAIFVPIFKKESEALLKHDKLHVFAVHTGAGLVGMCLTGLLADPVTVHLDGHSTLPFVDEYSKGRRLGFQVADALAAIGYTFTMTVLILYFMKLIVWLTGKAFSLKLKWRSAAGFHDVDGGNFVPTVVVDDLQPTTTQRWRDDLERRENIIVGLMSRSSTFNGVAAVPPGPAVQAIVQQAP
ncbi:ammonium transporter AmtB-like domain-containing protein [Immersiella caudata]|uniref:Ammonium transporter AmtB-like domain-containing protein n=1 Tax=Immersiella caudata TaxID=314043 RepID=A0AA39U4H4_9PEZI|nr:ammonium transporter AmtB-like domain-containing protein [Immersiella caudata]